MAMPSGIEFTIHEWPYCAPFSGQTMEVGPPQKEGTTPTVLTIGGAAMSEPLDADNATLIRVVAHQDCRISFNQDPDESPTGDEGEAWFAETGAWRIGPKGKVLAVSALAQYEA